MKGRDTHGGFVKGNSLNPGRLPRKTEEQYIDILSTALTVPSWKKIVKGNIADS